MERRAILLAAGVVATLALAAGSAHAATFSVNSTGDGADLTINGRCDASASSGKQCTLRAAIAEANNAAGTVRIVFGLPGHGVKTISPGSSLPDIVRPVEINGYTQAGASPNTRKHGDNARLRVVLDGASSGGGVALRLLANDSVIRGLVVDNFFSGIVILDGQRNKVAGNFIGTGPSGAERAGSPNALVLSEGSAQNVIGGSKPGARNLISGNGFAVILQDLAGGPVTERNRVMGNYIGTDRTGAGDLGNDDWGVSVAGQRNTVGGPKPRAGNVIAFNGSTNQDGVAVSDDPSFTGNSIRSNSIFANANLGIDLALEGVTSNDAKDPDTGANGRQNFPVISSARTSARGTKIKGVLNSAPNATFTLQFFANPGGSPDEGKTLIGNEQVTTDPTTGDAPFTFKPAKPVKAGRSITATATSPDGSTSEFSAAVEVDG